MNKFKEIITSALQSKETITIVNAAPTPVDAPTYMVPISPARISNQSIHPSIPSACVENEKPLPSKTSPVLRTGETDHEERSVEILAPQDDLISCLKAETARNNALSGHIEAQKRLLRHQVEFSEGQALQMLWNDLSMQSLLNLRESTSSAAIPPVDRLPSEAAELARQIAGGDLGRLQVACAGLMGLAMAGARGNWCLRDAHGLQQMLTDYMIISAPSGWGKSTMLGFLTKPFTEFEFRLQQEEMLSRKNTSPEASRLALKGVKQEVMTQIRKSYRKFGNPEAVMEAFESQLAEVARLESRLEAAIQSVPRLLLDRVTMAQLPHEMAAQGGVATIFGDEGGILRQIRPSNSDIFVKGATGEAFSTSTRGSGIVAIPHPCLAVLLLVQPSKLDLLFGNEELVDQGVAARFLPVLPSIDPGGFAKPGQEVDGTWLRHKVHSLLGKGERIRIGEEVRPRHTLELGPEATSAVDEFSRRLKGEEGLAKGMRHFLDRLPWHTKNLAGALHLLKHPDPEERAIDLGTMLDGIAFAEFFRQHAEAVYDPGARDGVIFAPKILRWIKRDRPKRFTDRDAHRGVGSGRCTAAQIRAGLDELERANYVRRHLTGSGRMLYLVHPATYLM